MAAVGDRTVKAILLTHAHDDHCRVAPALRERAMAGRCADHAAPRRQAAVGAHPHRPALGRRPRRRLRDRRSGGTTLRAIHTPGHAPGAVCFHAPDLGCVFTGDTLFQGGPGATGRSFSDEDLIKRSHPGRGCSSCPTRPWCTPGTATTPPSARSARPSAERRPGQRGRTSSAVPCPATRVSTIVASVSPVSASRLRSWSGTTSTPRFLIVSVPTPRSRSAARSAFSR